MNCECRQMEAVHCFAWQEGRDFVQALATGQTCPCPCHRRTDAEMVANFREFLFEMEQRGIVPKRGEAA